ncbi:MAG: hypothetical protein ABSC23_10760 [Bryobacteraceae bacterium]|jgi:hypothetical protein
MPRRFLFLLLLATLAAAEKYDGPRPPKRDLPYIKHASNLIPTEDVTAQESDKKKDDITYIIEGASSSAVTSLAEPIFLLQADKLIPEKLKLFKLEVKNGHREVRITARKSSAIRLEATRYDADTLWKIEVGDTLEPGEYALSQADDESNRAFCFRVR